MEENRRKLLTEYLCECWHKSTKDMHFCDNCNRVMDWMVDPNRTFTVPDDMHALGRRLVEKGDDFAFESYLYLKFHQDLTFKKVDRGTSFIAYFIDPTRFCSLVGKWLEHKEAL